MFDGWETRRRRGPGHDWALVRLAGEGTIERVVIDTSHFKGNAPGWVAIDVADDLAALDQGATDGGPWRPLLPVSRVRPHDRRAFARVADTVPTDSGEDVVRTVRAAVWGVPDPELGGLPLGVAFAALSLGFISGSETARVLVNGPWTRVSLARGHVLVRGPVATGLTPVRRTGTSAN